MIRSIISLAMLFTSCSDENLVYGDGDHGRAKVTTQPPTLTDSLPSWSLPSMRWSAISDTGAPPPLENEVGLLRGDEFVVWGKAKAGAHDYGGGIYKFSTGVWTLFSQDNAPSALPTGIARDGETYLLGTESGIYVYSVADGSWTLQEEDLTQRIASAESALTSHMIACGSTVVVFATWRDSSGNIVKGSIKNDGEEWTAVSETGHPELNAETQYTCGSGDSILLLDRGSNVNEFKIYYPSTNRWRTSAHHPKGNQVIVRFLNSAEGTGNVMVLVNDSSSQAVESLWNFDVVTNSWKEMNKSYGEEFRSRGLSLSNGVFFPFNCSATNKMKHCSFDYGEFINQHTGTYATRYRFSKTLSPRANFRIFSDSESKKVVVFGGCESGDSTWSLCNVVPRNSYLLDLADWNP